MNSGSTDCTSSGLHDKFTISQATVWLIVINEWTMLTKIEFPLKIPNGSSSLAMNNVLHCPSVVANLLSMYQFTRDNNCYFIFFSNCFNVKDQRTGTLFRGKSENGIYPFHIHHQISTKSSRSFAFVGVRVGALVWHSGLVIMPPTLFCVFLINVYLWMVQVPFLFVIHVLWEIGRAHVWTPVTG